MLRRRLLTAFLTALAGSTAPLLSAVGDPQLKTDHPWYPGELAMSTFDRLFATQAALYKRVTGRDVKSDEDKALASWLWRNTHYAHGEEGRQDCFAAGFEKAEWNRDYWTGLYAHGFGLCGTTHAQWNAEMNALLGHCRSRSVGVSGHNSFEVFLTGGAYGNGKWALLDHDISTVIFAPDGSRLLSIAEIGKDIKQLTNPAFKPERQRGWRVSALHDADARGVFDTFQSAEYLAGYAGPPPMVHLRRGELLQRYFSPGLEDGKTFVFWGMNYNTEGVAGLERNRTWVNQPQKMFNSRQGTGSQSGQARYGNAVYVYQPNFASGSYREGIVDEGPGHVTFEFRTPYVIGATPPDAAAKDKWGVYKQGSTNGLVIEGKTTARVRVSIDQGATWTDGDLTAGPLDLTDAVKGTNQYLLRFEASSKDLAPADIRIRTVCQGNPATFPQLQPGDNKVTFAASNLAIAGTGPSKAAAQMSVIDGAMGTKRVTLQLTPPRKAKAVRVYAAGWLTTGNPPDEKAASTIEFSVDGGKAWQPIVKDWRVIRQAPEPKDFWSQSFVWGDAALPSIGAGPIQVRFANSAGKPFRKVEAYLGYEVEPSPVQVTFAWNEGNVLKTVGQEAPASKAGQPTQWTIKAGDNVKMKWVEIACPDVIR